MTPIMAILIEAAAFSLFFTGRLHLFPSIFRWRNSACSASAF